MANTFKVVTFAAEPASAGTPYVMYTVASSTTAVVLGLVLSNINTAAITAEVELVSTTSNRGGANNVANGTSFLIKDVSIPVGSSLEILSGGKVVLEAGDKIQVDCSVADKLSGTLSIMEIT
jgi:hypothetical protein|tara:strand:- start:193 stop:558 length:366 start_codon:yes stop_codon:yes gene_type:complete